MKPIDYLNSNDNTRLAVPTSFESEIRSFVPDTIAKYSFPSYMLKTTVKYPNYSEHDILILIKK